MRPAIHVVAVVTAAILSVVAFGQRRSGEPIKTVRISGRIIDIAGRPLSDLTVNFRNLKEGGSPEVVRTNQDGVFAFAAQGRIVYEMYTTVPPTPPAAPAFKGIGTIEVVDGQSVEMGNIALRFSDKREAMLHLAGPLQITANGVASSQSTKPAPIAAVYLSCSDTPDFCAGGTLYIIQLDGKNVQQPKEKDQVRYSSPLISGDQQTVGWLVDSDFCCTSYPISLMLVVYRQGKPLRRFTGDGRAIFDWKFVDRGRRVAFYQDFLHGTPGQHYELRDVETGRLIEKWNGELTPKAPRWTRGMRS
jgi:hypothetical protein